MTTQLHSVLLLLVVHLFVVLDQLAGWALLFATERTIIRVLTWTTFGMLRSLSTFNSFLSLLL